MKNNLILLFLIFSNLSLFGQYNVKTVNRPDGITLKYFNPIPVAITKTHEVGLSIYKSVENSSYLLSVTVLFKSTNPKELKGNLLIQTTGNKGISLKPVMHKLININGKNVASSMFLLSKRDVQELNLKPLKLVSFYVNSLIVGLTVNKNKDVLIKEFSLL